MVLLIYHYLPLENFVNIIATGTKITIMINFRSNKICHRERGTFPMERSFQGGHTIPPYFDWRQEICLLAIKVSFCIINH